MKKLVFALILIVVLVVILFITGCNESQKQGGTGDPPADYIESFGNKNLPRLTYVLEQRIIKIQALIHGVDTKDKAGKLLKHQPGIIDYLTNFENRFKALENPNTLNKLQKRIDCLEEKPQCLLVPKKGYIRWQIGKGFFGKGWFETWNGSEWERIIED